MKILRSPLDALKEARKPYIAINVVYYGLVICGMAFTAFNPSLHQSLMTAVGQSLSEGPLAPVWEAYSRERVLLATVLTVGINLSAGSFVTITLPSLIIPFSGLLMAVVRSLTWGVLFSPQMVTAIGVAEVAAGLSFAILVFLEGQGYVLAALGAYLHGRAFLWPRSAGVESHREGYWHGLKTQGKIYALIALTLLVAAVYEVVIVVFALPALLGG